MSACTIRAALLAGAAAILPVAASAQSVAESCPATLRMADTGVEGVGSLEEAFGPFQAKFEELTGVELELFGLSNRTAAGTALAYDEVDFVFSGPSEFVLFQDLADIEILFSIARPYYGSSFFVKADSDIEGLSDLEGRRVALKDVGSTSGHIFPSQMLVEAGLDLDRDLQITMAGDARIAALVNGDVEAMGGGNRDIEEIEAMDPDGEYRVIAESGILPGDPVIMRANLENACKTALREVLSEHHEELWEALTTTERNADKFIERGAYLQFDAAPEDYDMVRDAYANAGIELN